MKVNSIIRIGAISMLLVLISVAVHAQKPGDKAVIPLKPSRTMLPVIKVTPRPISDDTPAVALIGARISRDAPQALSTRERTQLLRDAGVDFKPPRTPADFTLSARDPYISSAAYLVFSGNVHFSSASNQIFVKIPEFSPGISFSLPGFPEWLTGGRRTAGPQPDPPGLVAVRIRIDAPARYIADFSVSADTGATYKLRVSGADGFGAFPKGAGGQHVALVIDVTGTGYAQIDCWADRSFTFHNVVVTKVD